MKTEHANLIKSKADHLLASMSGRLTPQEQNLLLEAYQFAYDAHKGQQRKSGLPYIIHPLGVAIIVAEEQKLGLLPVIAALLHDVVEDTPHTLDEIKAKFGMDVAYLVGVLTKKKEGKYDTSKQIDNYIQILASVHYDPIAILLKIADRLDNMRSLWSLPLDKQIKIASETEFLYAPLATCLGLYSTKTEFENLSFKARCPREYNELVRQITNDKQSGDATLQAFANELNGCLARAGIEAQTKLRYREPYSIWRRMCAKKVDARHVEGKHYYQVIYTANDASQEKERYLQIYSVLTDSFKELPGSVVNYVSTPKENGYQSFHVKLFNECRGWEEVHISSERMVSNSQFGFTSAQADENLRAWLEKFKLFLSDMAQSGGLSIMEGVACSIYNDNIFVFTPGRKAYVFPKGATALDLAFEIHTEVGLHAKYAIINGQLSTLKTRLERGDNVEIGTAPDSTPDPSWLEYIHTYKAKRAVLSYLKRRPKSPYHRCPHCNPLPGDVCVGTRDKQDGVITLHIPNCAESIREASEYADELLYLIFQPQDNQLYPARVNVQSVDRQELLGDIIACVSKHHLPISQVNSVTTDNIVQTMIDFSVHSFNELQEVVQAIHQVPSVDRVIQLQPNEPPYATIRS